MPYRLRADVSTILLLGVQGSAFADAIYSATQPYMLPSMSKGWAVNELWAVREYKLAEPVWLQGHHAPGANGFTEFHVDSSSTQELVVRLLLERV